MSVAIDIAQPNDSRLVRADSLRSGEAQRALCRSSIQHEPEAGTVSVIARHDVRIAVPVEVAENQAIWSGRANGKIAPRCRIQVHGHATVWGRNSVHPRHICSPIVIE